MDRVPLLFPFFAIKDILPRRGGKCQGFERELFLNFYIKIER